MAKRIFRTVSWTLAVVTLIPLIFVFLRPAFPSVPSSAEAAKSFDQKLNELEETRPQGGSREVRLTEAEVNSKMQEILLSGPAAGTAAALEGATVHLSGDKLIAMLTIKVSGVGIFVTLGGKLGASRRTLEFTPTDVKMGTLPLPASLLAHVLSEKLNSPEMREAMRLPDSIKNVRVENGELVVQSQ